MCQFKRFLFVALLVVIANKGQASVLGDLAASMQEGQWAELETLGFDGGSRLFTTRGNPEDAVYQANRIIDFAESGAWDPVSKQFMFLGAPHGNAWRFIVYDEASNTWVDGPLPRPCMAYGRNETNPDVDYCGGHAYDWNAFDPASGRFFHTYWKFGPEIDIYTPFNNQWTRSVTPPTQIGNLFAGINYRYGAMEWFPELNSLLTVVGGKIVKINPDANQWEILPENHEMGNYHNVMQYSPVHQVMVFGGGNDWDPVPENIPNSRDLYRMDASGSVIKMTDAPFNIRVTGGSGGSDPGTLISADPVSGHFLLLNKQKLFYQLDPMANKWLQIPDTPPISSHAVSAAISEYGVVMYVTGNKVWLYKHDDCAACVMYPDAIFSDSFENSQGSPSMISDTTPSDYQWGTLEVGGSVYIDRSFSFISIPDIYTELDYLMTANDDKNSTGINFINFTVNRDVTVYIAHVNDNDNKPAWMIGWTDSGDQLINSDRTMYVYSQDFIAGEVVLGGNEGGPSMYAVLVRAIDQ
ncbi:MAG: hypothetical protein L3J24_05630 [Xanthomonadales bacterium]|nr:hypothetical protein [Xanthomonadales bacterium]